MTRVWKTWVLALLVSCLLTWVGARSAEACSCLPPDVTSSYFNHSDVFFGRVLRSLPAPSGQRRYAVKVERTFKSCLASGSQVIVGTADSSAACGVVLQVGKSYLLNASGGVVKNIYACGYNRLIADLTPDDLQFLNGRMVCCGKNCSCADGSEPVACLIDPCKVARPCEEASCVANYCGGCKAEFWNPQGKLVCSTQKCKSNADCSEQQYCASDGSCRADGRCNISVDCGLAGNTYVHPLCLGHGACTAEGQCGWQCGDARCVDYKGFDFGACDAVLGWAVVAGRCTEVSGCSAPGKLFPTAAECRASCASCDESNPTCGGS